MANWFEGLLEGGKKRHPLFALILGGVLIFLDNVGRVQVLRDIYEQIRVIWTNIHLAWPGHLLTWVGAAIALVGFASLLWPQRKSTKIASIIPVRPQPETAVPLPVMVKPEGGRIFVGSSVTPEYLSGLFDGKTDMQSAALIEPFVGKWTRISGDVSNIKTDIGGDTISVVFYRNPPNIGCSFDKAKWEDHISILLPKDSISVVGKIEGIERRWIWLSECEFEK